MGERSYKALPPHLLLRTASVVVSVGVLRLDPDSVGVVVDGVLERAELVVRKGPVVIRLEGREGQRGVVERGRASVIYAWRGSSFKARDDSGCLRAIGGLVHLEMT